MRRRISRPTTAPTTGMARLSTASRLASPRSRTTSEAAAFGAGLLVGAAVSALDTPLDALGARVSAAGSPLDALGAEVSALETPLDAFGAFGSASALEMPLEALGSSVVSAAAAVASVS